MEQKNVNLPTEFKDLNGKSFNRTLLVFAAMLGSFITVLNQSLLSTALPQLMTYFGIDESKAQWATTAYLLANGIMIPLSAALLENIPTKKLFQLALFTFGAGSALCAFSSNFSILILGRVIQAIGAGITMPLVNTVLVLVYPREKRGMAMGLYGIVVGFAPAIGPTLAGLILDHWNWHYIFYIVLLVTVAALLFSVAFMRDIIPPHAHSVDLMSIILCTLGFGMLLYGVSSIGESGISKVAIYAIIVVGTILSVAFIIKQLKMEKPLLELRVFRSKTFSLTTIVASLLNTAASCTTILLPIYIQSALGYSAYTCGLILLPGALLMGVVMLISGTLFDRYGAKKLVIGGLALMLISTLPFTCLTLETSIYYISFVYTVRYIGIALLTMPLQTAGINALSTVLIPHGTAVFNTSKQIVASIGSAVIVSVMSWVSAANKPSVSLALADPEQYQIAVLKSTVQGINVAFICTLVLTIIAFAFSWFIKNRSDVEY